MKKVLYTSVRLLQFVLVYAIFGAACGAIAGVFCFSLWGDYDWRFASDFCAPFGVVTGVLLAPLAFIPLRRFSILPTCLKLMLGTCLGSFLGAISPITAWGLGVMGFTFVLLHIWAQAPDRNDNEPQLSTSGGNAPNSSRPS